MGEYAIQCFLGSDLAAGDFGEGVEDEVEVFGEKVAAELLVEAIEDALEVGVSASEGFVVAGVGYDDVGVSGLWGGIKELLAQSVKTDAELGGDGDGGGKGVATDGSGRNKVRLVPNRDEGLSITSLLNVVKF